MYLIGEHDPQPFKLIATHDDENPVHFRGSAELLDGGVLRIVQGDEPAYVVGPLGWVRLEGVVDDE